jgi:GMP synthase-like glutamine amidotransferase
MNKKIRIFRHIDCEGPAYFQILLEEQQIPFEIIAIDQGEKVNTDLDTTTGLIFMGGSMSANDPEDWINEEIELIKTAIKARIPVMGICLGSQLMAKAMGAKVYPGPCMEIGWAPVKCLNQTEPVPSRWTKQLPANITVFHWHGETFDLPAGATALFANDRYSNQGFVSGPHLALQFHLEMEAESILEWLNRYPQDLERRCQQQHDKQDILTQTPKYISALQNHAALLFKQWLSNCHF